MLNTLALFSLLTIGWAEFQCDSPDSANGPYCRNPANSGGPFLIGKCKSPDDTCVTADQCTVEGAPCGKDDKALLKGTCVIKTKTCFPNDAIAAGKCAPDAAANTYCKNGDLVGQCNGIPSDNKCVTAGKCSVDGAACGHSTDTALKGICVKDRTCYGKTIAAGKCAPLNAADVYCKNGDLVGQCDGSSSDNMCVTAGKCLVDGAACGHNTVTTLKGQCIADQTCYSTVGLAAGKCAPGTSGDAYCKKGTYVGMCDGKPASNNCVLAQCYVDGKACGHDTHAAFMGKCVAKENKCYSTADISAGKCAPGIEKDTYCTSGNSVGQCDGNAADNTCLTASACTQVGPYCGHSSDVDLKGQCIAGGLCYSTVSLSGKCAPGTTSSSSCMKGGFLGQCAGTPSNVCNTASPCSNKEEYSTCTGGPLKGWCDASSNCVPTGKCDSGTQTYCKHDTLIGKCNNQAGDSVCITAPVRAQLCESKQTEDACGNSDVASGFTGYCEAAKGNCKRGKPVKIHYKIQMKPEALDTRPERVTFVTKLEGDAFNSSLMAKLSRAVGDNEIPDCAAQSGVVNGKFDDSCSGTSHEKGKDTCALICDDTFSLKRVHTRKCNALGKWIGDEGMCGKRCAATGGTVLADKTTLRFEGSTPEEGTLDCMAPAGFREVTDDDSYCILSCPTGYRVRYPSMQMCDSNTEWTGTRGSCELSTDVLASAILVLDDDDNHANIIQEQDEMFNNKFKASVAALLQGVSPHNVIIVDIKNGASRRLNEKAVLVNYSIREGATELDSPEGDDRLAPGGLRGIR